MNWAYSRDIIAATMELIEKLHYMPTLNLDCANGELTYYLDGVKIQVDYIGCAARHPEFFSE